MTKEKFTEMYHNQQRIFEERLSTNQKIMDLEVSIIQEDVIKSNAKKVELQMKMNQIDKATTNDLKVKMLNHLLKQNKLSRKLPNSQIYSENGEGDLRLAEDYFQILTDPEKLVDNFNRANKYEKDIRINQKMR